MKIKLTANMETTPEIEEWLEVAGKELNRRLEKVDITKTLTHLVIYGAIDMEDFKRMEKVDDGYKA